MSVVHLSFDKSELEKELRQGEIISNLVQYDFDSASGDVIEVPHKYAILVSQDCDLLRDFENLQNGKPSAVNGILLLQLDDQETIRARQQIKSDIWRRIERHGEDRYHLLKPVEASVDLQGSGVPALIADFRWFFALSPRELRVQLSSGSAKRHAFLRSPFREHFQSRFAYYMQRIALPD